MACFVENLLNATVYFEKGYKVVNREIVSFDPIWDLNCYFSKDNLE
jgi:hypothetical protein